MTGQAETQLSESREMGASGTFQVAWCLCRDMRAHVEDGEESRSP